jgi:glutathione S-transferase
MTFCGVPLVLGTPQKVMHSQVGAPRGSRHLRADGERLPLKPGPQDVPEPHPLRPASRRRFEGARDKLQWLDGLMAGKNHIRGKRFSLADIQLLVFLDFFAGIKQPINPELANIVAWHARVKARPSAAA